MISAIINTYNEAKNIERCLTSLSWVDEIILVDMGSTDGTRQIAARYKALIYDFDYTGFVEPARNFAISKAQGDWILVMDADEEVTSGLANILQDEAVNGTFEFYRLPRKNIIFGKWLKHAGWWPDYQIRFFKKDTITWPEKIHSIPQTRGHGRDLEPTEENAIVHYNYQSIEDFVSRLNRYTTVQAQDLIAEHKLVNHSTLIQAPLREFLIRYFSQEGYKDGFHGLAACLLQAASELVLYLKVWEAQGNKEESVKLNEMYKLSAKSYGDIQYWFLHELLKHPHSKIEDFIWKLKRKFHSYG
jgi:glycosyltransferase involved in cell wall biosynthesis